MSCGVFQNVFHMVYLVRVIFPIIFSKEKWRLMGDIIGIFNGF